jgi:hypothetical protein
MNIGLGAYDIFSRIVPGGFYLIAFGETARVLGWIKVDINNLKDVGLLPSVILLLMAYVVGSAMEKVGTAWSRFFRKSGTSTRVLDGFKQKYADRWVIDFEDKDWPVLRSYIYLHNPSVAEDADRFNALSIMLFNISFGLAILAMCEVIQYVNTMNLLFLLLSAFLLFLSYQVATRAKRQSEWFYSYIFEAALAYRLNLEERVMPIKTTAKRKNAK